MALPIFEAELNLLAAVGLGAGIGFERPWRQRLAGLRTNTLVTLGAATFILFARLTAGEGDAARVGALRVRHRLPRRRGDFQGGRLRRPRGGQTDPRGFRFGDQLFTSRRDADARRIRHAVKIAARVVEMKTMIRVHLPTSCPGPFGLCCC